MIDVKSAQQALAFIKAGYVYYRYGGWMRNFEELDRALGALETAQADTEFLIEDNQKLRERVAELEKRDSSTFDSYDEILKERNDACAREWDLSFLLAARKAADADVLTAVLALDVRKQPHLAALQDRLLSTSWLKADKSQDSQGWRAQVISQASFPVWADDATAAAILRAIEGVLEERGLIKREKP